LWSNPNTSSITPLCDVVWTPFSLVVLQVQWQHLLLLTCLSRTVVVVVTNLSLLLVAVVSLIVAVQWYCIRFEWTWQIQRVPGLQALQPKQEDGKPFVDCFSWGKGLGRRNYRRCHALGICCG
jgi:hypothetical protein